MKLLLSMPGGSEWILIILVLSGFIVIPILAIYYYSKSRRLNKELENVTREKDMLLTKLIDKTT